MIDPTVLAQLGIVLTAFGSNIANVIGGLLNNKRTRKVVDNAVAREIKPLLLRIAALEKAQGWTQRAAVPVPSAPVSSESESLRTGEYPTLPKPGGSDE